MKTMLQLVACAMMVTLAWLAPPQSALLRALSWRRMRPEQAPASRRPIQRPMRRKIQRPMQRRAAPMRRPKQRPMRRPNSRHAGLRTRIISVSSVTATRTCGRVTRPICLVTPELLAGGHPLAEGDQVPAVSWWQCLDVGLAAGPCHRGRLSQDRVTRGCPEASVGIAMPTPST